MAEDASEKQGFSGLERFLFIVTPLLFALVLVMVLLAIFNPTLRSKVIDVGRSIPVVGSMLPAAEQSTDKSAGEEKAQAEESRKQITDLQAELQGAKNELQTAAADKASLKSQITDLQGKIDELLQADKQQQLTDEEYHARIVQLSSMFASMIPSKAAPILQNMTIDEATLVLDSMDNGAKAAIMAKMDPKTAAEVTARLKDAIPVKDEEIAALQSRIALQSQGAGDAQSTVLDEQQLSKTFETMDSQKAAELMLAMSDVSPSKVLKILSSVNDSTRSSIIQEMSGLNSKLTSQLVSKLMTGK